LDGPCSIVRRNNQPKDDVGGGGRELERRFERAERRGGGRLPIVSGGEWSEVINKIERAAGPWISMAPTAWDNATGVVHANVGHKVTLLNDGRTAVLYQFSTYERCDTSHNTKKNGKTLRPW
jgi:hypothetical protein